MTVEAPEGPLREAQEWVADLDLERTDPVRRLLRACIGNPIANYFPHFVQRLVLRVMRSEFAAATWTDPGGWQSMVLSYADRHRRLADKLLCTLGTMPAALRNRRRVAARVIARLIDAAPAEPVEILCLGAGPGYIVNDAMRQTRRRAHATLVDLSSAAFNHGRRLAEESGHHEHVRFIQGDVRNVAGMLDRPPHIVKMLGICEYLEDACLEDIARTVSGVMEPGAWIVLNSLSKAHGTDRFFRRVFGLEMIHRSPAELEALLRPAGFGDFLALPEPMDVYHILLGRKGSGAVAK